MFTLRYVTDVYAPDLRIVLRTAADRWEATDVPGVYTEGAWTFRLDERRYQPLLEFKFVLTPGAWMMGDNLRLVPADGATYDYRDDTVRFQPVPAVVTENAQVQRPRGRRARARGRLLPVPHPRGEPATPPPRGSLRQERLGALPRLFVR
jgi:hypothetical protein